MDLPGVDGRHLCNIPLVEALLPLPRTSLESVLLKEGMLTYVLHVPSCTKGISVLNSANWSLTLTVLVDVKFSENVLLVHVTVSLCPQ